MRKIVDDKRLIYKCCSLYYNKKKTQDQICRILGLSRSTVSRILELGREQGIVKIEVMNPMEFQYGELEQQLEETFGLKEVIITENDPLDGREEQMDKLCETAFDYLSHVFRNGDCVGVTMGRTLARITEVEKEYANGHNLLFVPLFGGIAQKRTGKKDVQSNRIAVKFAEKFHGDYVQFLSPAVFSDEKLKEMFLKEETVRGIFDYFKKLRIVVMGIGIPEARGTALVAEGYLDERELAEFAKKGVVGDASLFFYDIHGDGRAFTEFNQRVAGISQEQLQKIDVRIGVAGGARKADSVKGAIRSGSINILITDSDCAQKMLESQKDEM